MQEYIKKIFGSGNIGFIDFMLAGKKLTDYTNMFFPYNLKKNDTIISNYFKYG